VQPMIPTQEQETDILRIMEEPTKAALIGSEMGQGKTLTAVEVATRLDVKTIVVICPLSVRVNWERTFARQGNLLDQRRIDGTKKGKAAWEMLAHNEPGIYILGREFFRTKDWSKIKPDMVIFDEVHAVQNRKSIGFRKLKLLKPTWKLALSGTPAGNKFQGMWSITRWLWPNIIDRSFWRWVTDWARSEEDYFSGIKILGEREPGAFVSSLPCYVRREANLETEYVQEIRYVELTPAQRKLYEQMEKDSLMWLEENPAVAEVPIVQRIRLRQVTLGVPYINEYDEVDFNLDCKSSKIDALNDIIKDMDDDEPLLVLCESAKFVKVVAHRLGDNAREWSGDVSHAERDRIKQDFIAGKFRFLVATIPSIAEGVDGLQEVCNHVVWLSQSDNGLLNEQAAARLHRTGQRRHVYSWVIQAENTYDSGVFNNLALQKRSMKASLTSKEAL